MISLTLRKQLHDDEHDARASPRTGTDAAACTTLPLPTTYAQPASRLLLTTIY